MTPEQIETVGIFSKQLETAEYLDHSDLCRIAKELLQIIESLDNWIAMGEQEPPKDGTPILVCPSGYTTVDTICWAKEYGSWVLFQVERLYGFSFTHWMPLPKHINDTIK